MTVRTRFAPSPTGYLHIGGVRTALFNWLFAKGQGGQFLLRIDDTDQQRNVDEALAPILHGLKWMGLDWDEGPGGRRAVWAVLSIAAAGQVSGGRRRSCSKSARPIATSPDRRAAGRARRGAEGGPAVRLQPPLAGRNRRRRGAASRPKGRQGVVRLLMPREGHVRARRPGPRRGPSSTGPASRTTSSSGPTAPASITWPSVVDDHDMQISHVIRAEEHLSNTPRQVFIFQQLGYELPQFAHLPYVAEPGSKTKLSKRKLDKYLKNRDFAAADGARPVDRPPAGARGRRPRRSTR